MKGHIRERSPGHWAIVIELHDPTTGKRRRKWHAFAGTKRKAQEECARLISALRSGTYLEPAKITVAEHMERWLEHVRSQVSPKTFERYCGVVRGNIVPALGKAGVREKGTKSERARTVALTALATDELRRPKTRQAEALLRLGVRQTDDRHVVAQADGQPLKPNSLTHEFVRFIAGTGLPKVRFHDLRHSHATHLLTSGVHPKVAQERLGHATTAITLDLYSHVLPGIQADAATRVDEALLQALDKHRAGAKG